MAEGCIAFTGVLFPALSILFVHGFGQPFIINFLLVVLAFLINPTVSYLQDQSVQDMTPLEAHGLIYDNARKILITELLMTFAVVHRFTVEGVSAATSIFNTILPPVGVIRTCGCSCEFWLSILLTMLGFFPGVVYAHYLALKDLNRKKLEHHNVNLTINLDSPAYVVSQ